MTARTPALQSQQQRGATRPHSPTYTTARCIWRVHKVCWPIRTARLALLGLAQPHLRWGEWALARAGIPSAGRSRHCGRAHAQLQMACDSYPACLGTHLAGGGGGGGWRSKQEGLIAFSRACLASGVTVLLVRLEERLRARAEIERLTLVWSKTDYEFPQNAS